VGKYGTDLTGFGAFEGGVNTDKGAPIVSTSSDGSSAIIFGPAALREMEAGLANGDFQIPPDAAGDAITTENPLPYFSASDSSSGRITLALADSTASPGTNLLRFTITSGVNADSFYVERIVPIVSSEARSFNYQAHAAIAAATSSANYTFTLSAQYLESDQSTTTGTEGSLAKTGSDISSTIASLGFSYEMAADPHGGAPAPADASYLRLRYTISLTGSVASATFDLAELRVDHGVQNLMFADQASPDLYGYGQISLYTGGLIMEPNGVGADRSNPTLILDSLTGTTQIDSSIRTSGSLTITNVVQDGLTTTYTVPNSYTTSDVISITGVTPTYFNQSTKNPVSPTATSFKLAITPALTKSDITNSEPGTTFGSRILTASTTNWSTDGWAVSDNISFVSGQTALSFSRATVSALSTKVATVTGAPLASEVLVTGATRLTSGTATYTAAGHTFSIGNLVYVLGITGNTSFNVTNPNYVTITATTSTTFTGTRSAGSYTTGTPTFTADSRAVIAPSSGTGGTAYKNTAYTSGGSVKAPYPAVGNIELISSGNSGATIIKQGFVSGSPSTVADLRFLSSTGPRIQGGGTNGRIMFTNGFDFGGSTSSTTPGILITKSTAGQPTTTLNGSGTTDAFADALRNGGLAVDSTNLRIYAYTGGAWRYAATTSPSDSRLKEEISAISGALDTLRQLMPVAFKWKRPEAHQRADAVDDNGQRLGFIADQVATTDLKHWVEDMGVGDLEADLIDTDGRVLGVNIPQNEMEALVVQALLDIDTRLKALEGA
jgi:hypothetical protein